LFLKTSNDFTYSLDTSDEPLYKLCAVLKNSQPEGSFIPLEFAFRELDMSMYPAALQIQEFISGSLKVKLIVNGTEYEISKEDILSITSSAISY
jgi:hypothetical protein